ncbi:MAG: ribosome maturation factor RimM [Chloroflexota bacterium]
MLVVAQIRGPHGVRGEVRVEPRTDVADRVRVGVTLDCEGIGPLTIMSLRGETASPIVLFQGYTTRPAAVALRDRFLRVPIGEARRAAKGSYLWADLVGLAVRTPDGAALGVVRDLIRAGETDVLVVRDDAGHEALLPMLASVVRDIDLDGGVITAVPQEQVG